jgi:hypothetical protein
MGIKRRMIDIGKKITFYPFCKMFESVQFFSHLHLKYAKSAIMTPKNFSGKISRWVSQKHKISCWFQIHSCWLSEMPLIKVKSKKPRKMHKNKNIQISHSFLATAFLGAFASRAQAWDIRRRDFCSDQTYMDRWLRN